MPWRKRKYLVPWDLDWSGKRKFYQIILREAELEARGTKIYFDNQKDLRAWGKYTREATRKDHRLPGKERNCSSIGIDEIIF